MKLNRKWIVSCWFSREPRNSVRLMAASGLVPRRPGANPLVVSEVTFRLLTVIENGARSMFRSRACTDRGI
jgi:hypothetical protein